MHVALRKRVPEALSATAAERSLLEEFLAALRAEHEALSERRTDDLSALADRKLACAQRLEQSASPAFRAMLRDTQQRTRRGEAAASTPDGQLWLLLREAAELNRTNGILIDQHLKQVRLSLAHIDPVSPTRQLYGRDGQGSGKSPGRSFGSV